MSDFTTGDPFVRAEPDRPAESAVVPIAEVLQFVAALRELLEVPAAISHRQLIERTAAAASVLRTMNVHGMDHGRVPGYFPAQAELVRALTPPVVR